MPCDGPLLLQVDLPFSAERDFTATPDPEVQCVATNSLSRLGDEGQREPFRVVARFQKGEGSEETEKASEWKTLRESTGKEDGDTEDGRGDHTTDGTVEAPTDDQTTRPSGAGGAQRMHRPVRPRFDGNVCCLLLVNFDPVTKSGSLNKTWEDIFKLLSTDPKSREERRRNQGRYRV
ncbi:hypothetical protein NDU88_003468 [Pleurodeles waltl]|uniref:Uncharacterized protein n=1 Tax=Pleurodeles waltl TaxID=8319 RepID=A0AAV7T6R8_PLEWA|nr:hypothetical protein NDU88_003468 [Pleurodeles waltl]